MLCIYVPCLLFVDDDGGDAVIVRGNNNVDTHAVVDANGSNCREETTQGDGGTSSLEDEVDSTSSRDMNFSTEQESLDNRLRGDYYEHPSDNSSDEEEEELAVAEQGQPGGGGGRGENNRTPQYRHSVTTNWSSSDEETEKYRDHRSSLFRQQRRSETSSPDYFQPPSRGELIELIKLCARISYFHCDLDKCVLRGL